MALNRLISKVTGALRGGGSPTRNRPVKPTGTGTRSTSSKGKVVDKAAREVKKAIK